MHRFRKLPASRKHAWPLSLATAGFLGLGACSNVQADCPYDQVSVARNLALPDGCILQESIGGQVQIVSCTNGKTGFHFSEDTMAFYPAR